MLTPQYRVALVRRAGDGLVQVAAVTDVAANLQLLQSFGVEIDARMATKPGRRARAVVDALRQRFRHACTGGPWYAIDFFDARTAITEYDLETGERIASREIGLHSTVHVDGMGVGKVTGFSGCGRVEVTFNHLRYTSLVTLAPRSQVAVVA